MTNHTIGIIWAIALGIVPAIALAVTIYDRFKPVEKRIATLQRELHAKAAKTGRANISMVGLSESRIIEIADQEGFDWIGYRGQNEESLIFQRRAEPSDGSDGA